LLFQPKHQKRENSNYISSNYYNRYKLLTIKRGGGGGEKRAKRESQRGKLGKQKGLTKWSKCENQKKRRREEES